MAMIITSTFILFYINVDDDGDDDDYDDDGDNGGDYDDDVYG